MTDVEWKSGFGERPVEEALCALANSQDRRAGVLFVGISDGGDVIGVPDLSDIQKKISDLASDVFNYPMRVDIKILTKGGKNLLAVVVPPCTVGKRPCHLKRLGPFRGAYGRVGPTTRVLTEEEARHIILQDQIEAGYTSFDLLPLPQKLTRDVFSDKLIGTYVTVFKERNPSSSIDRQPFETVLRGANAVVEKNGSLMATPAGILFFSESPEAHLPQSMVDFIHFWGTDPTEKGPDGSFYRDAPRLSGPLPQIIDRVEALIYERIQIRGVLDGFKRKDVSEYPRFAFREAIVNAVAHRDYTLRGSRIQVRLFPDRIEVKSPGGLPPPVTVDNIEEEQATRNHGIVQLLHDLGYMEEKGFGVREMIRSLREAGLQPPQFEDTGASFTITMRSHVLMTEEALEWLRQFDSFDLSERQRLALAYLKENERIYNRDYARLNDVTSVEATRDLSSLVDKDIIKMESTRGGAYYVLSAELPEPVPSLFHKEETEEEKVLSLAGERKSIANPDVVELLSCEPDYATRILVKLARKGKLTQYGKKRGATYALSVDSTL